ncbi:uncharacterized protein ASCRUDRAFT_101405 [Ascoidea rubescens DSM 1968]|uniref:Uncharacterized protein n=1 Tax=Ascoidea rubescens DSM 1968 TaxID=1344418 RepID=A0A1D2VR32_9ASCO|nr:hypothetical protein ASCRUDRAFT_101405 [Ascoidea rubescens DSM 1968]ODV64017.1 hypothetical protein ASCRUDRAFT_101405 [Ascoidea rubescens DSM 1968]
MNWSTALEPDCSASICTHLNLWAVTVFLHTSYALISVNLHSNTYYCFWALISL